MTDDLKQEIEAEILQDNRSRRVALIVGICFVALLIWFLFWWLNNKPGNTYPKTPVSTSRGSHSNKAQGSSVASSSDPEGSQGLVDSTSPASTAFSSAPKVYVPSSEPVPLDKPAFIAGSKQLIAEYSQIVGLLTFDGNITDIEKASRIKQATVLSEQSLRRIFGLRGMVMQAGISDGPYMQAVEVAEGSIASIDVGLTFMGKWVDDRSKVESLNIGLGGVGEGADGLLELSSMLNGLQ